ncbi:putative Parkin co-regulated protein [Blattamonas nauphoetae]|uniref:Parkin co-regulated protein n=1 Tax=Blattamonas nauphoetae TaxID=2049346 RepID=A0ABQ9XKE9_9EUKA|nr:putative Parkin co-regulated protein [Blattamonas nauphoetae]
MNRPVAKAKPKTSTKPKAASSTPHSSVNPNKISSQRYDRLPLAGGMGQKAQGKTAFATWYSNGSFPCQLMTGTAKMSLRWKQEFELMDYSTLLPIAIEGLMEAAHPYISVSQLACRDMLEAPVAAELVPPILPTIAQKLREVLVASARISVESFSAVLDNVERISVLCGEQFTPLIQPLLVPIGSMLMKRTGRDPKIDIQSQCMNTLQVLDENGGPQAYEIIHKKIPTYQR